MENFIYKFQTKAINALFALLLLSSYTFGQNSVSIGSETVKSSAVLYLQGNGSQGLILPIVSNVSSITVPESGMIVYQSSDSQVYYHDGTSWSAFGGGGGGDQTLTLSGNSLSISNGNSVTLSGVNPSSVGQLFMWDGTQWTASSATAASSGQVLQWNGSSWTPGDLAPSSLLQEGAVSGQVLKWNGSSWIAQDDLQGGGTAPTLSNGELMIGNGTSNSSGTVSGDLSMSGSSFTIANGAVTDAKISDVGPDKITQGGALNGQVLQWNTIAGEWQPATVSLTGADDQLLTYTAGTNVLAIEDGNSVDLSDLQQGLSLLNAGTSRTIDITDGTGITLDVADNDNDAANELQSLSLAGTDITLSNGGGTVSVNDADADATNELVSGVAISGNEIQVSDAGGTQSALISGVAPSSGQVLKWNGSAWEAAADDVGAGGLPGLSNAELVTNDGSSNVPVAVGGDLTMDNAGSFTIQNIQGTSVAIGAPSSGQVLKWDGSQWAPAADAVGAGGLPVLTNAQLVTNDGTSNIGVTVTGDVTFANNGTVTIQPDAVNSAKIADGSIADADISDVDNSKVTGLGALALLGSVGSAQITDGAVSSADIANGTISNIDIADVDPSKINQSGATPSQVLKWDGAQWAPADEAGGSGIPPLSSAQLVTNDGSSDVAVTVSGDITFANDGTVTISAGAVNSAKIADGSISDADISDVDNSKVTGLGTLALLSTVTSAEITDGTISGADLSQMGAAAGEVLSWDGASWAPAVASSSGQLNDLSDATVTGAAAGEILVGDGSVYTNVAMSGDVSMDAAGATTIQNTAGDNIVTALNDGGTSGLITESRIAGLGVGVRAILGSNNSGAAAWVTGGNSQLLGTDAGGNLAFYPNAPFLNGTGTPGNISRWDGTGSSFNDSNLRDDNTDITVDNGLGLRFGAGSRITGIRSDADGGVRDAGTAVDDAGVTELAVRSAIDANAGATPLLDGEIPVASGGTFVASNLTDNGQLNSAVNFNLAGGSRILFNGTAGISMQATGNHFLGINSGASITSGASNVFVGNNTGAATTTGDGNAFVGNNAGLANNTGSSNSFFGAASGQSNTTGTDNTFIGIGTGNTNTSGNFNTIIGSGANVGVNGLSNATAIGAGAVVSQSNSLILGSNANVGIGTSTPSERLTIVAGGAGESVSLLGDGTGNQLALSFWDEDATNYSGFIAPANINVNYNLEMPADLPAVDGQLLSSNISGVLSWATPAGVSAANGLNVNGATIELGGALIGPTTITQGGNNLTFSGGLVETTNLDVSATLTTTGGYWNTDEFVVSSPDVFFTSPLVGVIIGSGAQDPFSKLDVEGNMAIGANYSGSVAAPANGLIVEGNVGIGTATPSTQLHISGTSGNPLRIDGTQPYISFYDGGVYEQYIQTYNDDLYLGSQVGNIVLSENTMVGGIVSPVNTLDVEGGMAVGATYSGTNTAPANSLIIEGQLGVGTFSPSDKVHIVGSNLISRMESSSGLNALMLEVPTTADPNFIDFQYANSDGWVMGSYGGTNDFRLIDWPNGSTSNYSLYIEQGGTNNVGIGTNTPVNKLDVEGGMAVGATYSGTNAAPANGLLVEGRVGIGKTTASYPLDVENSGSGVSFQTKSNTGNDYHIIDAAAASDSYYIIREAGSNKAIMGNAGADDSFRIYNGSAGGTAEINMVFEQVGINANPTVLNAGSGLNHAAAFTVKAMGVNTNYAFKLFNSGGTQSWYQGVASSTNLLIGYNGAFRGQFSSVNGTYSPSSDRRLKKSITGLTPVLEKVMQLKPSTYLFNHQEDSGNRNIGLIAQEVIDYFPSLVTTNDQTGFYTLDYATISVVAVKAIQEQQIQIDEQKFEIDRLKAKLLESQSKIDEIDKIKAELASIKSLLLNNTEKAKEDK